MKPWSEAERFIDVEQFDLACIKLFWVPTFFVGNEIYQYPLTDFSHRNASF